MQDVWSEIESTEEFLLSYVPEQLWPGSFVLNWHLGLPHTKQMRTVASVFVPVQVLVTQKQKSFSGTNEMCKMWPEAQELIISRNLKRVLAGWMQMCVEVPRLERWDSVQLETSELLRSCREGRSLKQNQKKPKHNLLGNAKIFSRKLILDMCVFKRVFKVA